MALPLCRCEMTEIKARQTVSLAYKIQENNGTIEVALEGQLNFSVNETFHTLIQRLVNDKPRQVVFNLSGLSNIDSVGLGLLYIAHEDLSGINSRLSLAAPRANVANLLAMTEARQTFEITP